MHLGLIGTKKGMTRIFDDKGVAIPVTVIDISGNSIVQVKEKSGKDGYSSVQLGRGAQKESRMTKPELGHLKKHGAEPLSHLREVRLKDDAAVASAKAATLDATLFAVGAYVDVLGVTKGKGFTGVMKRYDFNGQPATHGHMMHRRTGAIGCRSTPGLVWKNQKMPGHHGCYNRTVQNLIVVQSRVEDGVILVRGAIPGHNNSQVYVRPAIKRTPHAKA